MSKLLKQVFYQGYEISIHGSFGYDTWDKKDAVYLETKICKDGLRFHSFKDVVTQEERTLLQSLFNKPKKTLKQSVMEEMESNVTYCINKIERMKLEKEMTEGLLDSLDIL